jgi:ABC-2 type transport system ATP-binding protein
MRDSTSAPTTGSASPDSLDRMNTEPVVELSEVRKRYGDVEALKGVDIAIRRGEVVAVLGPNGAGKTTSISLMLGLAQPTSGAVRVFGLDPGSAQARSRTGAMLQESGLPEQLTVTELVRLFRSYYPTPLLTDRVIQVAGLREVARKRFGELSGGQRQRVYFALAICGDPELLVLDEPTVALDVEGRRLFLDFVGEWARSGRTIVLTTHHMEEAGHLARRIIVLDRGVVLADESPQALRARVPGKRIRIRLGAPLAADALAALPVSGVRREADHLHLLTTDPAGVLGALYARQVAITDVEVAGADLEEAFVQITGRS